MQPPDSERLSDPGVGGRVESNRDELLLYNDDTTNTPFFGTRYADCCTWALTPNLSPNILYFRDRLRLLHQLMQRYSVSYALRLTIAFRHPE